jgi:hypothetical protein
MKMYKLPDGAVAVAKNAEGKWEGFVCFPGLHDRPEGRVWRLPAAEKVDEAFEAALGVLAVLTSDGVDETAKVTLGAETKV